MKKNYFQLFACCIPVSGAMNKVICDLQRGTIQPIPESLYVILTEFSKQTINQIKAFFDHDQDDQIDAYYQFLEEEEWGFWCDDPSHFPDLDLAWDHPSVITNAIIDINASSDHPFEKIFSALNQLACEALQLRSYDDLSLRRLKEILGLIGDHRLKSIELILKHREDYLDTEVKTLCRRYPRISSITFHTAPQNDQKIDDHEVQVNYTIQPIDSSAHCGIIHPDFFISSLPVFSEAQKHNSCLNRKIAIDTAGYIKNCPSMSTHFGHVQETTLEEVVQKDQFRSLWSISKDEVAVCRDCEYRYVCSDCRAYTEEGARYGKPAKCNYDPYTGVWQQA